MTALPTYDEALRLALQAVPAPEGDETVPLDDADGRVLRESITADRDLPPFNRAQMDGYAVRAAAFTPGRAWPVVGHVPAGAPAEVAVPDGACVSIATGAPLPDDVDAVIQHELSDRGDPVRFTIDAITAGRSVHPRGVDASAGDTLVPEGVRLRPQHVGLASTVGLTAVRVAPRPRVTILSSGDEIRPSGSAVEVHQIRNSNGPQTAALVRRMGASVVGCLHVADALDATIDTLRRELRTSDLIVSIGGISAGDRDFIPAALAHLDVEEIVRGAAIQPGRPILVGRSVSGAIVVGLPGNPVSSLVCACLFVWPIIDRLQGLEPTPPWRTITLTEEARPNPKRQAFRPARLTPDRMHAAVASWKGSGDLAHTAATDGVIRLPVQDGAVPPGTVLPFLEWP